MAEYPKIFEKAPNEVVKLYSKLELARAMYTGAEDPNPTLFVKEEEKRQAMMRMVREALLFLDLQCEQSLCEGNHKVGIITSRIKSKIIKICEN